MLNHMPKFVFNGLAALTVAIPVLAWSRLPIHHARAPTLSYFSEYNNTDSNQSVQYDYVNGAALFSWQETSLQGFGHVDAKVSTKTGVTHAFEFKMVRLTSTDASMLNGEWDVFKNGSVVCAGCKGAIYVSSPGHGNPYLKGSVANGPVTYFFSGDTDPKSRLDY